MDKLGKYLIRRELGKGAMGIVYEGFDPLIERIVAIKTIRPEQLNKNQAAEILARFKREAQAAGRLNHPHIVAIYDYGEDAPASGSEAIAYIAMEFIKGRELRDYFEANERFPLPAVERIMGQMLDALEHAHARGVIHRDVKPANIILLEHGAVKVADFGIARLESSELTQAGAVLGTPAYMSPEQFLGQPVDKRSDLFSCGVVLYQFLTGEKPFTGNVTTIMYKVLTEEPLAPSMLNTTLPPAWDAVVRKAMAKKPAERYQSAAEFAAAIRDAAAGASVEATLVQPAAAGTDDATVADSTSEPTLRMQPPQTRPVDRDRPPAAKTQAPSEAPAAIPLPSSAPSPSLSTASSPSFASSPAASPSPAMQMPAASHKKPIGAGALAAVAAGVVAVVAAGAYLALTPGKTVENKQASADTAAAALANTAVKAEPAPVPAAPAAAASAPPIDVPVEPGTMVISALGAADPRDPRFNGDPAAAQAEARADAKRNLIDKALGVYIQPASLDRNYAVIEEKLLADPGVFIKRVISEGAPQLGKDGLVTTVARAAVRMRAVQKSLNQMSKEERIEFIRNGGDPKISVMMAIRNADTAEAMPSARSQLAENIVKERIRSFGFRVWTPEVDAPPSPEARQADFHIQGEVKVKLLSMRLPASGLTVSKTALTSWTVKATDRATGEEIYLNTALPKAQSWASEDQALVEIGRLVGEEFSKNFFLQHFSAPEQKVSLTVAGLPAGALGVHTAQQLLRELRGIRQVLDAQPLAEPGRYQLRLAEGNPSDIIEKAVLAPLNAKLGQSCFLLAGASGTVVNVNLTQACADDAVRARLETQPPAGFLATPRGPGHSAPKPGKPTAI
ncbi:MAG: serine/threonine-protein kinase [Burkholderiales bacterium]